MSAWPPLFSVMLRRPGEAGYAPAGKCAIATPCGRGEIIALKLGDGTVNVRVDELFIPPQCEEHCIGTIFVAE